MRRREPRREPSEDEAAIGLDVMLDGMEERLVRSLPRPYMAHIIDMGISERTREIFVIEDIDDEFAGWFTKVFRRFQVQSEEPITIWLNTPGGDEEGMLVFYDLVTTSKVPITIVGSGSICSAGVLMLACGHKRLVTENCTLMSHESRGLGGPDLRHSEAKERRKWEDWLHDRWFELMARCTEPHTQDRDRVCDAKFWKQVTERKAEYWLLGGQAMIDHGLADAIYDPKMLPKPAQRR